MQHYDGKFVDAEEQQKKTISREARKLLKLQKQKEPESIIES